MHSMTARTVASNAKPTFAAWHVCSRLAWFGFLVIYAGWLTSARAETIGYRLELRACLNDECRPLRTSPAAHPWNGLYACQSRAATLEQLAAGQPVKWAGLPSGKWTFRARCEPIVGLASA
jgi:hypothetical protein